MAFRVLTQHEVERLLPMDECIEVMADALAALARHEVHNPLRFVVRPPGEETLMGLMPAHRASPHNVYALKTICIVPANPARGLDAHQGSVTLFDGDTGEVRAFMNASAITEIRTAAVSAVATRLLARPGSRELAILGAGVQARSHLEFVVEGSAAPLLARRLGELGLPAAWRVRRGRGVVTLKSAETVQLLLRRIGAGASLLELETRQVARTLRGELNRVINAESANLVRTVHAAGRQMPEA